MKTVTRKRSRCHCPHHTFKCQGLEMRTRKVGKCHLVHFNSYKPRFKIQRKHSSVLITTITACWQVLQTTSASHQASHNGTDGCQSGSLKSHNHWGPIEPPTHTHTHQLSWGVTGVRSHAPSAPCPDPGSAVCWACVLSQLQREAWLCRASEAPRCCC